MAWLACAGLIFFAGFATGCGQSHDDQIWEELQRNRGDLQGRLSYAVNDPQANQQMLQQLAGITGRLIDQHENADPAILETLRAMQDDFERLADGQVNRSEVQQVVERHQGYWEHLGNQEVPPEYR